MNQAVLKDALALSVSERIQLVEAIWDTISIPGPGQTVPISNVLREELDRRAEQHRLHPESGTDWENLKRRLGKAK